MIDRGSGFAGAQRVDKPIGTLADVEKGRDIFAKQIRRRTGASLFCGKASNAAENSMFSAAFFILLKYLQLFLAFFMLAVDRLFRQLTQGIVLHSAVLSKGADKSPHFIA